MRYLKIVVLSVILAVLNTGCSSDIPSEIQDVGSEYLDMIYLAFTGKEDVEYMEIRRKGIDFYSLSLDYYKEGYHEVEQFEKAFDHAHDLRTSTQKVVRDEDADYLFEFIDDYNKMAELLDIDNQHYIEDER